ncbi:C-X-C motif chemokine 11-6-like [Pimephales promelas]|uniref:C-X-C motif chemokine 11-6-like n=1 Tax=Pimephales promelas TaxID=90988 RepID=UPI0019559630|nr:C-X-C motif chemokine 11-6-like [Pimephales promelas]KAG1937291.1 C-X-C motif chemokine 11-6-like [Pimephales promelas]
MKTIAAFILLACLIAVGVKGQDRSSKGRCFCADKGANMVLVKNIEKVEIIPPSPSCHKREIIVTLKNGAGKKCLNPESKFTKNVILKALDKRSQQSVPHSTSVTVTLKNILTSTPSASTSFK